MANEESETTDFVSRLKSAVEADFATILDEIATVITFDDGNGGKVELKAAVSPVSFDKAARIGGFVEKAQYEATFRNCDIVAAGVEITAGKTCAMQGRKYRIDRVESSFHGGLDRVYLTER